MNDKGDFFSRDGQRKLKPVIQGSEKVDTSIDAKLATCMHILLLAAPAYHKLHLKITGPGSYAGHKALNEIYDSLPGLVDDVIEGYQGASEKLLELVSCTCPEFNTVDEAIAFAKSSSDTISTLQKVIPYSEINNELDNIKSALNSLKYKLIFLK